MPPSASFPNSARHGTHAAWCCGGLAGSTTRGRRWQRRSSTARRGPRSTIRSLRACAGFATTPQPIPIAGSRFSGKVTSQGRSRNMRRQSPQIRVGTRPRQPDRAVRRRAAVGQSRAALSGPGRSSACGLPRVTTISQSVWRAGRHCESGRSSSGQRSRSIRNTRLRGWRWRSSPKERPPRRGRSLISQGGRAGARRCGHAVQSRAHDAGAPRQSTGDCRARANRDA